MSLPSDWNDGGSALSRSGQPRQLRDLLHLMTGVTLAEMTAIPARRRHSGMRALVNGAWWSWHATSVLTSDDLLVAAADDAPSAGRWLVEANQEVTLELPITFATADAAALLTLQAGSAIVPRELWWKITTNFTGGSSSAIGVSSTQTATTKGDLLGGAGGDVAASLTTALSPTYGTQGAAFTTVAERRLIIPATKIIRFDRITSAFTAGAGSVMMRAWILSNDGA
jgi:hypothetical protein